MAQQAPFHGQGVPQQLVLSERIELFVAAGDTPSSDLFCVVSMKPSPAKEFEKLYETEVIGSKQNPIRWTKRFSMDWFFEEEQWLKFDVYCKTKKNKHKLVGTTSCVLGEIFAESGSILQKKLMLKGVPIKNKKTKRFAHLIVMAAKLKDLDQTRKITVRLAARNLMKVDTFSKSDPYFLITRDAGVVYGNRGQYLKDTLNPQWPPFEIDTQAIANNDPHAPICIELWDWNSNGKDVLLGKVMTSLDAMKQRPKGLKLFHDSEKLKNKNCGVLDIVSYKSSSTFVDYLAGGVDMSLLVGIDFTASNGHPSSTKSLHCIQDDATGQPIVSPYQHALRVIGNIVSIYDTDQMYPIWGFGLNVPDQSPNALHCFNLNFSPNNPEVHGIHGLEQTYVNAVNLVSSNGIILSGPTFFSPILERAAAIAEVSHNEYMKQSAANPKKRCKPKYFVLLIITDGCIDDLQKSIDSIVQISNRNLPLSIIIVGVGNEDFTKMTILDADDTPLVDSKGQAARRDIVQFVPFNKVAQANNMSLLAKETLMEIPAQFMSYVSHHEIEPLSKSKPKYAPANYDAPDSKSDESAQIEGEQKIDYNIISDPWMTAPVPPNWSREFTEDGKPFYVDHITQKSQWTHPAAVIFMKKIKDKADDAYTGSVEAQASDAFGNFGDDNVDWASFD